MSRAIDIFRGALGSIRDRFPGKDGDAQADDPVTRYIRELLEQVEPSTPATFLKRFRVLSESGAHERGLFVVWRGRGAYRRFREERQNLRSSTEDPVFPRWRSEDYLSEDLPELEESVNGIHEEFAIRESVRRRACDRCQGKKVVPCSICNGTGRRDVQVPCPKCQNRPNGPSRRCKECSGSGYVTEGRPCDKVEACADCEAKGWVCTFVVVSLRESPSEDARFIDVAARRWCPAAGPKRRPDFSLDLTTKVPVQFEQVPEALVQIVSIAIENVQRDHREKEAQSKNEHDSVLGATLDRRIFSKFIKADLRLWRASYRTVRWEYVHRRRNPFSNEPPRKTEGDLWIVSPEPDGIPEQIVWGDKRPARRFFLFFGFGDPGWESLAS